MKFYKSRYFWFFIISLILVSFLVYSFFSNIREQVLGLTGLFSSQTEQKTEPQVFKYNKITYFIPVTGVKSFKQNITLNDLKNSEINILSSDSDLITKISGLENSKFTTLATIDELSNALNTDLNKVGIINFTNVSFRLKTLAFDGVNLTEKSADTSRYNLKVTEELTSDQEAIDISNYEPSQLKIIGHTGSIIGARGTMFTANTRFGGDYSKLFESTKTLFDKMDFTSGTMEAPVLGNGVDCGRCMSFVGADKLIDGIKFSGIDLLSTASNHIMDGGDRALENTQKKLDEAKILHLGASLKSNDEAGKPLLVDVDGLKIAYIAFNDTPGINQWAGPNKSGAANISDWVPGVKYEPNEERIKYFLQRAKDLNPDLVFVIAHWGGQEYTQKPTAYVRDLAKLLVKHGADAILGDHPHWVQEMEYIDGKPVFYCVGNYIFDQTWSEETMQGISIELSIYNGKVINFRLHPHYARTQGLPLLVAPADPKYQQILNRVWQVSELK